MRYKVVLVVGANDCMAAVVDTEARVFEYIKEYTFPKEKRVGPWNVEFGEYNGDWREENWRCLCCYRNVSLSVWWNEEGVPQVDLFKWENWGRERFVFWSGLEWVEYDLVGEEDYLVVDNL